MEPEIEFDLVIDMPCWLNNYSQGSTSMRVVGTSGTGWVARPHHESSGRRNSSSVNRQHRGKFGALGRTVPSETTVANDVT